MSMPIDRIELVSRARELAMRAHSTQFRKYTNEPYFVHLQSVANIVNEVTGDAVMIAAAYLHDVLEDTPTTLTEVEQAIGMIGATYVEWLTDTEHHLGNRKTRKEMDRIRLAQSPYEVQTIKMADLIDNASTIVQYDPKFARQYLREKEALLAVLTKADGKLREQAHDMLKANKKLLEMV